MKNIHQPSRKQTVLFFILMLVIGAWIVMWVFFINKGTLTAEGPFPFSLKAGNEKIICTKSPCTAKLTPRRYTIIFKKEGFYDDAQTFAVMRGRNEKLIPRFRFIPVIREKGELVLPIENAPLKSTFLGLKKFENFPQNFKEASFSGSGNQALLNIGKEVYIYNVQNKIVQKTDLDITFHPTWAKEDIVFFEEFEGKQILKKWNGGKNEFLVSFERPLKNPNIIISLSGNRALIYEVHEKNNRHAFYFVDFNKKSRRRLEIMENQRPTVFTPSYLFFERLKEKGEKEVVGFDSESWEEIKFPALDGENIVEIKSQVLFFLSSEKQDSGKPKFGVSLEKAFEEAKKETFDEEKKVIKRTKMEKVFITEFSRADNIYRTVGEIALEEGESIHRLTFDSIDEKLYFILKKKSGEKRVFEVILKP